MADSRESRSSGPARRLPRTAEELPPFDRAGVRWLASHAFPHLRLAAPMVLFLVLGAAAGLPQPLIPMWILDRAIPSGDRALLAELVALSLGLAIAAALAGLGEQWFQVRFRQAVGLSLRREVYRLFLSLPPAFFDEESTGYLMARASGDVAQAESLVSMQVLSYAADLAKFAGGVVILFWIHWRLALLAAVILPLYAGFAWAFRRRTRTAHNEWMEAWGGFFQGLQEAFSGIQLLKALGRGAGEAGRILERIAKLYSSERRATMLSAASSALMGLVTAAGMAAVLGFGASEIMDGRLTVGKLFAFLGYLGLLYGPSRNLAALPLQLQPAIVGLRRLRGALALEPEPSGGFRGDRFHGAFSAENVAFGYAEGRDVLAGASLAVREGERVGVAGETGSGKSTLLRLLLGLYRPRSGRIEVDGRELGTVDPSWLRSRIGYLPQDPFFFADTVEGNLRWAAPEATGEEIREALRDAEALGFAEALPRGLSTVIGERGQKLSGGEKQRLAAARALLLQPDVLVMDEGTSHLDAETEARLLRNLMRRFEGRTMIVVSHRPAALSFMDRVVAVRGGKVETGGLPAGAPNPDRPDRAPREPGSP
jgi:ATP-binding cassette, subfamily B, bacterial